MQDDPNPRDQAFREEVRTFVREALDQELKRKVELGLHLGREDYLKWYKPLYERGWITPAWPVEYGGTGWTPMQRLIFDDETLLNGAPRVTASGIQMLGPVLIAFGSPEQKAKYLPEIRRSETFWAQGFSEPGAGSDLASLRTRAVLDGDEYVVTGQKIWTSYAQFCDMMFALVRTDPDVKPQAGISFLLIDLNSPGVKVRPIRTLDGGCDLNEVFLDDVRVPRANLIGEPNKGWTYAKHLLGFERTGIAGVGATKQQLMRLRRFATHAVRAGRPVAEDPVFVRRLADLEIDALALEYTVLKMMTERGGGALGVEASMLKVRGTELRQAVFELLMDVGGPQAARGLGAADPEPELDEFALRAAALTGNYFDSRKLSIYGGANEIQRNVLAKGVLEL